MSLFVDVQTFWDEIAARPDGPFAFRFYLQPAMAALLAARDGLKDARTDRTPYFWKILSDPERRAKALKEGLTATARVIFLGILMDLGYQYFVLGSFRLFETLFVAFVLCFLPYLLLRGFFTRMARLWTHPEVGRR